MFLRQTGTPPKKYVDLYRVSFAEELLHYSDKNIRGIAEALGFADAYAFSRFFKRMKGIAPYAFRKRGRQ